MGKTRTNFLVNPIYKERLLLWVLSVCYRPRGWCGRESKVVVGGEGHLPQQRAGLNYKGVVSDAESTEEGRTAVQ